MMMMTLGSPAYPEGIRYAALSTTVNSPLPPRFDDDNDFVNHFSLPGRGMLCGYKYKSHTAVLLLGVLRF